MLSIITSQESYLRIWYHITVLRFVKYVIVLFAMVWVFVLLTGCSTSGIMPAIPRDETAASGTVCAGLWTVSIDPEDGSVSAAPAHSAAGALNGLWFLEPPAMANLKIDFSTLKIDPAEKTIEVDVILHNPIFTGTKRYNGFDVRGIVFGPMLENADGYTRWFNPIEFSDITLGYKDGLLGTGNSEAGYLGGYNGYRYFASGIGVDETPAQYYASTAHEHLRGVFQENETVTRRYLLKWPDTDPPMPFGTFNYAVYLNYSKPQGGPPFALDDFPPSANCPEAVFARADEIHNTLYYIPGTGGSGGGVSLEIHVFDWQGADSEYSVEVDGITEGTPQNLVADFASVESPHSAIFTVDADFAPPSPGPLQFVIKCMGDATYGESYYQSLMPGTHPLYDLPIVVFFPLTIYVDDEKPGINLKKSGPLPQPIPGTISEDFCVVGDVSGNAGVYYFADVAPIPPDIQGGGIFRYPLDYSSDASLYYNLSSPFDGHPDQELWGDFNKLSSLELTMGGAGLILSSSTEASGLPPYLHRDLAFWFDENPLLQNGITSPKTNGVLKWVDVSANHKAGGDGIICGLAITDELMKDEWPPVNTQVGLLTVRYPYGFYDVRFNKGMFEKDEEGDVDGKVDDRHASRLALDGSPHSLTELYTNAVIYILESDPTPSVEIFELNVNSEMGTSLTNPLATIHGFDAPPVTPVDISCFPAWDMGFSSDWNWLAVLEDADNGWSVSLWEQDGAFVTRSEIFPGTPLHMDIDEISGRIHVWYEIAGQINYGILNYNPSQ